MCNSPNMLADKTLVACRKCLQCRSNRIDEWVGRCIAESKTSVATTSLTLTYGRDQEGNESHSRAAILTYSDVQKYFKQLRKRGYPCRYLMTGEHGSKKGRAHWHGIVFWLEDVPETMLDYGNNSWHRAKRDVPVEVPIVYGQRFNEPCWVHGFSHWEPVRNGHEKGSIAYACKYINKDVDDPTAQSKLAMSKLPPIGTDYFISRAQRFVDERIAPQDPFYQFPSDARRKNGNIVNFMLRGKIKEIFCEQFIQKWNDQVGGHLPQSEFIDDYLDRKLRLEIGDYEYIGSGRYIHHPSNELGNIPWLPKEERDKESQALLRELALIPSVETVLDRVWEDTTPYRWPKRPGPSFMRIQGSRLLGHWSLNRHGLWLLSVKPIGRPVRPASKS